MILSTLRIPTFTLDRAATTRLELANDDLERMIRGTHITVASTALCFEALNRLQDDLRLCLRLVLAFPDRPWIKLETLIPLDGDGSLYESAFRSLGDVVKLLR